MIFTLLGAGLATCLFLDILTSNAEITPLVAGMIPVLFVCATAAFLVSTEIGWSQGRKWMGVRQDSSRAPRLFRFLVILCLGLPLSYLQSGAFAHRLAFFLWMTSVSWLLLPELTTFLRWSRNLSYYPRVATIFFGIGITVKVIPGAYLPPFWGGIGGWKFKAELTPTVSLNGLQLVRDDGEAIWYSSEMGAPQSFHFRQLQEYENDDQLLLDLLGYYMDLYEYHFPYLTKGSYRHHHLLGSLSYPSHVPSITLDYSEFPPSRIASLQNVVEIYDRATHQMQERKIQWSHDLGSDKIDRPQ